MKEVDTHRIRNRWQKLPALSPIYFKTVNRRDSELVSEPLKLGG